MAGTERPAASTENHLAAVRFATSNLERLVVHTLLKTKAGRQKEVFVCVMKLYAKWAWEVEECGPLKGDPDIVEGPDCKEGWIPVGDDCIPPPGGGGPTGGG